MSIQTIFSERLRAARTRAGLSQKQLGILADIDEFVASARVNQYERGKHLPDLETSKRLADVLGVPMAYLYCPEESLAEMLLVAHSESPPVGVGAPGYSKGRA